jgi:hypothetical protein
MNDRQRLEAIVAVISRYLPPNGISKAEAMSQIIELVDPLPENPLNIVERAYFAGKQDGIDETIELIRSKYK